MTMINSEYENAQWKRFVEDTYRVTYQENKTKECVNEELSKKVSIYSSMVERKPSKLHTSVRF